MEESTEAHMETDVSSTTEDVEDTQEVTGSSGKMEMVIVVEQVKEEETSSHDQSEKQPSLVDVKITEVSSPQLIEIDDTVIPETKESQKTQTKSPITVTMKTPTKSPVKDVAVKTPTKSVKNVEIKTPSKSPIKNVVIKEPVISPSEPELPQKDVNKDLPMEVEIEVPILTQQVEEADSSVKQIQIEIIDNPKTVQNSPEKVSKAPEIDIPKNKEPKPVEILPTKELQLNVSKTTPVKPILVKISPPKEQKTTPTKESLLVEKSPINGKVQSNVVSTDTTSKNTPAVIPVDVTVEGEICNDSQLETNSMETSNSDLSEKEHNKSISRELKSLINSAKESKIISECTQLTSKTRKSRSALDSSLNTSNEADRIYNRRHSNNSQKSNCSEKSEKVAVKRSMRSQNPEFVSKVKQFLNSVTGKGQKDSDDEDEEFDDKVSKDKVVLKVSKEKIDRNDSISSPSPNKIKKIENIVPDKSGKLRSDMFCWRCHWAVEQSTNEKTHPPMHCTVCPRSFHYKCLSSTERNKINTEKSWVCPECMIVLQAESSETRSPAMKKISLGMLCDLLKHAIERMMDLNGVEPFLQPVDRTAFPDYDKYVVHPMDLSLMKSNIGDGLYGSTEAFLADAQWIMHNSIIFNTLQSKLTAAARALVRGCRAELAEIEACPECYAAAHARRPTWFTDVCTTPHVLLWAKLKGFPYWPAKGMSVNCAGHVDVRFFGAHDRAWVPAKDCFLYSEKDPNNFRSKRQDIIDSMQEAEQHIRNISRKYGQFVYPPFKTPFDPTKLTEQLKMMIPSFEGEARAPVKEKSSTSPAAKEKRSSNSKSSKSSYNDGDTSETEETNYNDQSTSERVPPRKMADGAEIAREDEESASSEKTDVTIDVDSSSRASDSSASKNADQSSSQSTKSDPSTRKRRRSELEEAVITIMDTSTNPPEPKKKKENKQDKDKKKNNEEPTSKEEAKKSDSDKNKNGEPKRDAPIRVDESSNSSKSETEKEKQRVTPIRIALVQKDKKHNLRTSTAKEAVAKIITPIKDKDKDSDKTTPQRQKTPRAEKTEKANEKTKEDKVSKAEKRRNSRNNRSLTSTPKSEKAIRSSTEKKSEKTAETKDKAKENSKENGADSKEKGSDGEKSKKDKINSSKPAAETSTSVKDRLQFDDDTTLAVIARESKTVNVVISNNTPGMPTISCVRSLSTNATANKTATNAKSSESNKDSDSDVRVFTHTTTESIKNMKDAASKLQKLRNDAEPMVGRVGVRAFARMTSPDTSPKKTDDVQVEIKAEPIDVDDADRQIEKLNLMNAFRLRPVNPIQTASSNNLREVRINKVLVATTTAPLGKKNVGKVNEPRPRAKKSFPQPKKPEDGQLNSKNSMVYIPIQPAMTQAPVRPTRVLATTACPPLVKSSVTNTTAANNQVNTVTTPVMQVSSISTSSSTSTTSSLSSVAQMPGVHTVPLMTSVNGQWMFSFQPVMSVGAIENSPSPPIMNGVSDRGVIPSVAGAVTQVTSSTNNNATAIVQQPLAKTTTDTSTPGEPPRLQQRPSSILLNPLDANVPIAPMPPPSTAGPITAKLNQNAVKLADFFRTLLEDTLEKIDDPTTQLTMLKLQLEQVKWKHQAEIDEIKHNHELTLAEIRALFEKERVRAMAEARRASQVELEAAVKVAKSKQWCANCSQEAQFYCCWNTSYCDYPCQRAHWAMHFNVCAQQRPDGSSNGEPPNPSESRLQPQPEVPKSSVPALTVGGKLAAARPYAQDSANNAQKNTIIVGMVEESGAPAMKCLGTYKSSPTQNISPIILNKQIMNNEENANKKVVSSGGYLIVGGGANSSSVVTPARRTHTIQYFT